ncbi:MAG: hypothetical protein ACTSQN_17325 [Candidatus Heimdallarchaeota archaeon]
MARVTVIMTDEDKEQIFKIAKEEFRPLSRQILHIVREYIRQKNSEQEPIQKIELPSNWQIIKG